MAERKRLVDEFSAGRMSRRSFVRKLAATGLTVGAAAAVATACAPCPPGGDGGNYGGYGGYGNYR